jgi:hypothetical protein
MWVDGGICAVSWDDLRWVVSRGGSGGCRVGLIRCEAGRSTYVLDDFQCTICGCVCCAFYMYIPFYAWSDYRCTILAARNLRTVVIVLAISKVAAVSSTSLGSHMAGHEDLISNKDPFVLLKCWLWSQAKMYLC